MVKFAPVILVHATRKDVVEATSPSQLVNYQGDGYQIQKAPEKTAEKTVTTPKP